MQMLKILKNFNELVVFQHTIFSLPFILISMFVASGGIPSLKILALALLAAFFARNFAMAFNRFADAKFDAENPRTKNRPSVDGRISRAQMLLFLLLNALAFVAVSFFINSLAFYLSVPFLGILAFYSLVKRFSAAAHLFLGLAFCLGPIAGSIAAANTVFLWTVFLSLGVLFWVAGFDLLYALADMEYDKKRGLFSIPAKFGVQKTLIFSRVFHLLTVFFWACFVYAADLGAFSYLAVLTGFIVLMWESRVVSKSLSNINKAFFAANGYLGVVFFILVTVDLWL